MEHKFLPEFLNNLDDCDPVIRKKFEKQLKFLLNDMRHPSLRAKKYDESRDIWQARIDKKFRFYFKIEKDAYVLLQIKTHKD